MTRAPEGVPRAWLDAHKNVTGQDCLIWPFWRTPNGYGRIRIGKKSAAVHRLMCVHRHGLPPTPKYDAAHSCGKGNLGCVNPQHVSWKTRKDNQADQIIHGTINRGERNGSAKLTKADVMAIRSSKGVMHRDLARQYGVSDTTIASVVYRQTWAWL